MSHLGLQGPQFMAGAFSLAKTLRGRGRAWGEGRDGLPACPPFLSFTKNYSQSIMLEKLDSYFYSALFLTARGEVRKRENKDEVSLSSSLCLA